MPFPPSSLLTLTLILAFLTSTLSTPSFYTLLQSHGLPIGLFPSQITNFTLNPTTGQFSLSLPTSCNAKFETPVHYDYDVNGTLNFGKIEELSGVSAQDLFLWFPVKGIRVDVPSSGLIYFDVGGVVSKQFSLSLFENPPDCVDVGPVEIDGGIVGEFPKWESRWSNIQLKSDQGDGMKVSS